MELGYLFLVCGEREGRIVSWGFGCVIDIGELGWDWDGGIWRKE